MVAILQPVGPLGGCLPLVSGLLKVFFRHPVAIPRILALDHKDLEFLVVEFVVGRVTGMEIGVSQEVFGNELFRVLLHAFPRERGEDFGKGRFPAQNPLHLPAEGEHGPLILRPGAVSADLHVEGAGHEIQDVRLLIALSPDVQKPGVGQSLLAVDPKGLDGIAVSVHFDRHRGFPSPFILRHVQILEFIGQVEVRRPIDVFIERPGGEDLGFSILLPPAHFREDEGLLFPRRCPPQECSPTTRIGRGAGGMCSSILARSYSFPFFLPIRR